MAAGGCSRKWLTNGNRFSAPPGGALVQRRLRRSGLLLRRDRFPSALRYTPGVIGDHCVMPNIRILQSQIQSDFLDAVVRSNQLVEERQTLEATAEVTK